MKSRFVFFFSFGLFLSINLNKKKFRYEFLSIIEMNKQTFLISIGPLVNNDNDDVTNMTNGEKKILSTAKKKL